MDAKKIDIIQELYRTKCIVTPACEAIGLARSTYYKWLNEDTEFKEAVDELNNVALDFAEGKLFELINGCDTTAIIFFLKTRGKKRGYIEKSEVEHSGNLNLLNEPVTFE